MNERRPRERTSRRTFLRVSGTAMAAAAGARCAGAGSSAGQDAFYVVCPSLPGYGFSEAPKQAGCDCRQMAGIFAKLMARLGYTRYGAQGGDWGAVVSTWLAAEDADHVSGLHLNTPLGKYPEGAPADVNKGLSPKELKNPKA